MKLLALDGNSILNRAFYGIKLLTTKDGRYTNGIYGFINILNKLLELENPDAVAVAFDLHAPTFRHQKYAEYKAGRKGMPPELAQQLPVLKELIKHLGYCVLEAEGYEADDILGTLASACKQSGDECVIATGDRDTLQLVCPNVRVLLAATKMGRPDLTEYTPETIKATYGVEPEGLLEIKALMGDSSDNIPGVAGIGQKTATELICRFGSIDYIYENIDSLDIKPAIRQKLIDGRDSAYLSRELGKICCEAPVSLNISDYLIKERDEAELVRLFTSLEFFSIMERMNISAKTITKITETPQKTYTYTEDKQKVLAAAQNAKQADLLLDLNTLKVSLAAGDLVTLLDSNRQELSGLLGQKDIKLRVNNSKALYKWAYQEGININNISFDTELAGYLCSPSSNSYETGRLAQEYNVTPPEVAGENVPGLAGLGALHSEVCERLKHEIETNGQTELLYNIELPLSSVLAKMELTGFLIDVDGIIQMGDELSRKISDIEQEIYHLVGYEFNLNSPKQLGEALFVKLGLPTKKKTKTGFSTSAEVLESLRYAHPAVELLLEYRQLAKLKSTYCDGLAAAVGKDGRIHSSFNQTETRTGRISSTEPNLQNIPIRTEEGRQLRRYFKAADGYVLIDADYSQIELRVLAHMANDRAMIEAFNNNSDIHTLTASKVFGIPAELVTPLMRSRAKTVNFGIIYGMGAYSLSQDLKIPVREANQYIKGYFATYPQVAEYMERVVRQAKETGYVSTLFGRRRYLPELSSSNANIRAFGERVARNMPIQGTAADIIKIAMIRVDKRLSELDLDARLILQVHDELIIEASERDAKAAKQVLIEEMQNACKLAVELSVDVSTGKTWFEAKG
ncbi:MAG TPA: DNA polymerase I [Clostridiales bacterium]|nr:DNA polymerase I [Clostridiales bacterium]